MPTARTGLPSSDSTNSLTHLADSGCIVCGESAGEKGEVLVESKHLVKCACTYSVHLSCWHQLISVEGPKICPSCQKSLVPPYLIRAVLEGHEEGGAAAGPKPIGLKWFAMVGCIIFVVVAFSIGLGVSQRGH